MKFGPALGMVAACILIAGTANVLAADAAQVDVKPAVDTSTPVANTQIAAITTAAPVGDTVKTTDPLHADARWPLFANCINNTATPDAFQGCLQMAFMGVGPNDQVVALLTH